MFTSTYNTFTKYVIVHDIYIFIKIQYFRDYLFPIKRGTADVRKHKRRVCETNWFERK